MAREIEWNGPKAKESRETKASGHFSELRGG